ncbi:hypothetical protein I5G60_gp35 [Mycobacterium phage Saguaro]|uniref:Uncharacterized protein n=1 Tax=Mycobacterium phage Saguaro TaxID=2315616 RepID=A0A386KCU6_9CAUD|nr:hypothetical protein I5G60_gp35 [Mycobacterium phage Saguaro]AYD82030.1 hypothetical protein SEA_SAGUARO_35 [Mycobacterium phage Saguaro]
MTQPHPDEDYEWALGFDAATVPVESMPPQPQEPLPLGPDASEAEQRAYAGRLAEYAEAKRRYDADVAALLTSDANWSSQRTPLATREEAEAHVKEFLAVHATNPLVRNAGLYRAPRREWERVELS